MFDSLVTEILQSENIDISLHKKCRDMLLQWKLFMESIPNLSGSIMLPDVMYLCPISDDGVTYIFETHFQKNITNFVQYRKCISYKGVEGPSIYMYNIFFEA